MHEKVLIYLASIVVLGIFAQWLGWLLRVPAILFLLALGLILGPVTGYLDPNKLFGDLLLPSVSLFVGLILFEGGLSLKFREFRESGQVIWKLVTVGVVATWVLGALGARYILGFSMSLSLLLGAILVVSGPTVVGPILRQVKPLGPTASILKWEGIVIDPIGVLLMVLVFEAILVGGFRDASFLVALNFLKTLGVGILLGILGAGGMILLLKYYLVPDHLENPVSIMMVVGIYGLSNFLRTEAGLFSVTLMGILLANQKWVPIKHIVEFKENLRVLLISLLFILLAARLTPGDLREIGWEGLLFLAFLLFVVRPLAVVLSTWRSRLTWQERIFLSWMAPRGIVAAAVSSLLALELTNNKIPQASLLVPYTFLVIVGTVVIYGFTASWVARRLGLSNPNPQGVLIVGAHIFGRELGRAISEEGFPVLIADTNRIKLQKSRMMGLETYFGSVLSDEAMDEINFGGMGKLLALTSNDEVNSLAGLHFKEIFGRAGVYQIHPEKGRDRDGANLNLQGRLLFSEELFYDHLRDKMLSGWGIKKTKITQEFDYQAFLTKYDQRAFPLLWITENKDLGVVTTSGFSPQAGHTLVSLVPLKEGDQA